MLSLVFPGQGSQSVGMGIAFYQNFSIAREVFEEANDTLRFKLSRYIFEESAEKLTQTNIAQPALLTVSMAMVRVIEEELGRNISTITSAMAGHSLGEYTALCAAGVFSFADAVSVVHQRGNAMHEACQHMKGGMLAVLGLPLEDIEKELGKQCFIANDNAPGQVIVSGEEEALNRLSEKLTEAKRILPLPVSGPFHSPYMQPATETLHEVLAPLTLGEAKCPVYANYTAQPFGDTNSGDILSLLLKQLIGRVRWRELVLELQDIAQTFVEVGAGKVLTGLNKRILPHAESFSINTPKDLDVLFEKLKA